MVSWLHPWHLMGLAALAIPIIAHLIGHRRSRRIPFAAIEFLLRSRRRLAWWERLRRLLVLMTRLAFVAAFTAALARPMPPLAEATATTQGVARVLVLDASWSMTALRDGTPLWRAALDLAHKRQADMPAGDVGAIVFAGPEPLVPLTELSASRGALQAALDSYKPMFGVADMDRALVEAGKLLAGAGTKTARIEIIGDLARNSYSVLSPLPMVQSPEVLLLDPARRSDATQPLPNGALSTIRTAPADEGLGQRWRITVEVTNYGPVDTQFLIEIVIDGKVVSQGSAYVPGGGRNDKTFTVSLKEPGLHRGLVRLRGEDLDGLPEDNSLPFVLQVSQRHTVLAINGQRRSARYRDELFYFERALRQTPAGQSPLELRVVLPAEAEDHDLQTVDVVVLANVAAISKSLHQKLQEFVTAGGGLLITVGEQTSPEYYNAQLADLLPHPFHDFQAVSDPGTGRRHSLGVGTIDWEHPLFARLDRRLAYSLEAARIDRYMNVAPGAGTRAMVPLRLENEAPLLVERSIGAGRVLLLCTSLDRDFGDLAIRTAFLPLLHRMVRYLAGGLERYDATEVTRTEPVRLTIPTSARALRVTPPAPEPAVESPPSLGPGDTWVFSATSAVGVYTVEARDQIGEGEWRALATRTFLARPSLAESDFAPITVPEFTRRLSIRPPLGGGTQTAQALTVHMGNEGESQAVHWSAWLLVFAVLLLGVEVVLAN